MKDSCNLGILSAAGKPLSAPLRVANLAEGNAQRGKMLQVEGQLPQPQRNRTAATSPKEAPTQRNFHPPTAHLERSVLFA